MLCLVVGGLKTPRVDAAIQILRFHSIDFAGSGTCVPHQFEHCRNLRPQMRQRGSKDAFFNCSTWHGVFDASLPWLQASKGLKADKNRRMDQLFFHAPFENTTNSVDTSIDVLACKSFVDPLLSDCFQRLRAKRGHRSVGIKFFQWADGQLDGINFSAGWPVVADCKIQIPHQQFSHADVG